MPTVALIGCLCGVVGVFVIAAALSLVSRTVLIDPKSSLLWPG
jgi:hypothetical protein